MRWWWEQQRCISLWACANEHLLHSTSPSIQAMNVFCDKPADSMLFIVHTYFQVVETRLLLTTRTFFLFWWGHVTDGTLSVAPLRYSRHCKHVFIPF